MKHYYSSLIIYLVLFCFSSQPFCQAQHTLSDMAHILRTDYLQPGGGSGLDLTGEGMTLYIYEVGKPLITHPELGNRVLSYDYPANGPFDGHATAVTGIAVSAGIKPNCRGMAFKAIARVTNQTSDVSDLLSDVPFNNLYVSNHSYGILASWLTKNPWSFGAYNDTAQQIDSAAYKRPFWLGVTSSGNESHATNPYARGDGYERLPAGLQTAKNTLTVTSIEDPTISDSGSFIDATDVYESVAGPTNDLRIKPDIAGFGDEVEVPYNNGTTPNYKNATGTSMSAAGVSGSLLLLQQYYAQVYTTSMRASTLKGLALHTADDLSGAGPDAITGWGLLNAKRAAGAIRDRGGSSYIEEITLNQGESHTIKVPSLGRRPIIVSICWTDPPGKPVTGLVGGAPGRTPSLVNDLDVRVKSLAPRSDGRIYTPYLLTAYNNTGLGDNKVDPFERVDILTTTKGFYAITVTHKGILKYGKQRYSLIITGIEDDCEKDSLIAQPTASALLIKRKILSLDEDLDNHGQCPANLVATQQIVMHTGAHIAMGSDVRLSTASCSSQSSARVAAQPAVAMSNEPNVKAVQIYPNPVSSSVTVTSTASPISQLQLMTSTGQLVSRQNYSAQSSITLNVASFPQGIYVLMVTHTDGTRSSLRFVKAE